MLDIGYFISTNRDYASITLPKLYSTIPIEKRKDFIVVINQSDVARVEQVGDFEYHFVTDHSFGWSGVIEQLKYLDKHKYFFGMACTSALGPAFFDRIEGIEDTGEDFYMGSTGQDNLAVYSGDFLKRRSDFLLSNLNCDKEKEVATEGEIFRGGSYDVGYYPNYELCECIAEGDVYGTGVIRRTYYYHSLDFYKYKSNWGQTSVKKNWGIKP